MKGRLYVNAAAFVAPGIGSVAALFDHFDGAPLAVPQDWSPTPQTLPRRQQARLSESIRLAIMTAEQITAAVPRNAAWVFASSVGEGESLHEILTALCQREIMIQPLRFQNAVHNAAQGQWSILVGATGPATSIAAYDDTPGAGLLKAMVQAALEGIDVGIVIFDAPLPGPLHVKRPISMPMATALALSRGPHSASLCQLDLEIVTAALPTDPAVAGVATGLIDSGNPVRFVLPLLAHIHWRNPAPVVFRLPGGAGLSVKVSEVIGAA